MWSFAMKNRWKAAAGIKTKSFLKQNISKIKKWCLKADSWPELTKGDSAALVLSVMENFKMRPEFQVGSSWT